VVWDYREDITKLLKIPVPLS